MTSSGRFLGAPTGALPKRLAPIPATLGGLILSLSLFVRVAAAQGGQADPLESLRPVLTPGEAALVQASADLRGGVQAAVVERLRKLSRDNAGQEISGLAQLLVAKASLTVGRFDEASAAARHPDIDRTSLGDQAFLILARAKARTGDFGGAASAYLGAIDAAQSDDVRCSARMGASAALQQVKQGERRVALLGEAAQVCGENRADALLDLGEALLAQGSRDEAFAPLEELERAFPTSPQAQSASARLGSLLAPSGSHPRRSAREDFERRLARAQALLDGGQRRAAVAELRRLRTNKAIDADMDADKNAVEVALGRGLVSISPREATAILGAIPADSPLSGEARLWLARMAPEASRPARLHEVANQFAGTPAAEGALYSLATFFQKDARHEEAAPYYRRLIAEFADGTYAEAAAMRAAFEALRAGRPKDAAEPLETMARRAKSPAGFLYWAGMARLRSGDTDRAAVLLNETADRFRNTWYGSLASAEVSHLPTGEARASGATVRTVSRATPPEDLPGPLKARLRQLLLIGFAGEAIEELKPLAKGGSKALEARALIEANRGELRNAIVYMKRARPEFIAAEIKDLPSYVWTTIYPLRHGEALKTAAAREALDPALVAALVCQESTFDERAKSVAGARGLMQIMPYTGRPLARQFGMRYSTKMLHEPETSLSFGTRYFKQMMDRFGSRPEAALAAYNAGPHRVDRWLGPTPQMRSDEFTESIPFTETRNYVMIILGARDQYRRLYGLEPAAAEAGTKPGA